MGGWGREVVNHLGTASSKYIPHPDCRIGSDCNQMLPIPDRTGGNGRKCCSDWPAGFSIAIRTVPQDRVGAQS